MATLFISGMAHAKDEEHTLGPTGLSGVVSPTSVKVTRVARGAPSDGKIKAGDVIAGAGGALFKKDVRRELADAIDRAETEQEKGLLALMLQDGRKVDLQLKVLGSYSATAPYNCPKSDAIITRAADYLVSSGKAGSGCLCPGLLGLLATGEQKYIDVVKAELAKQKWITPPDMSELKALIKGDTDMGYVGWYWGYYCVILGEYYMLTHDESVLPALKAYATGLAMGQDAGGLWGHRMATEKRNGRLPGYAQINQPSMTCFMGMLMAQKCGIKDPALTQAIEKTHAFYATFIGKGAFNYGVHGPNTGTFNNNGTSASGALAMALKGNTRGAAFFSRLAATSYDGLETGHASYWFNVLWTPLGANLSGPEVTTQFFEKARWLQTMYRSWDGSFTFDGEDPKMGDHSGAALLAYCLPRRKLYITGKNADESIWLKGREATDVIELSHINYAGKSEDELIAMFGHPIPQVTRKAVWALREKKGAFIPKLVKLLKTGTKIEKQSAIGYFGYGCSKEIALPRLDDLGAVLRDPKEDPDVRAAAASALSFLGAPAYTYYGDMVKLVVEERPADRFGDVDWSLGTSINALCATPFKAGLVTDKKLFYKAATKLADNKRQHMRADGLRMLAEIPLADFYLVADTVMHVVKNDDPTYHSYHSPGGPVGAGVALLANLNIEDGMQYTMDVLDDEDGKWAFKVRMVMDALTKYGPAARPMLEKLKADPRFKGIEQNGKLGGQWKAMVQAIESPAEASQKMISFEAAKQAGLQNAKN